MLTGLQHDLKAVFDVTHISPADAEPLQGAIDVSMSISGREDPSAEAFRRHRDHWQRQETPCNFHAIERLVSMRRRSRPRNRALAGAGGLGESSRFECAVHVHRNVYT